jgi:hypothetical protein
MSGLFGSKPRSPDPVRMPTQEDAVSRDAAARQRAAIGASSGRTSTIMTRPSGAEAGTRSYGNSLLGQAG